MDYSHVCRLYSLSVTHVHSGQTVQSRAIMVTINHYGGSRNCERGLRIRHTCLPLFPFSFPSLPSTSLPLFPFHRRAVSFNTPLPSSLAFPSFPPSPSPAAYRPPFTGVQTSKQRVWGSFVSPQAQRVRAKPGLQTTFAVRRSEASRTVLSWRAGRTGWRMGGRVSGNACEPST